jgi:hypothetical protein
MTDTDFKATDFLDLIEDLQNLDINDKATELFTDPNAKTYQLNDLLSREDFAKAARNFDEADLNTIQNTIDLLLNNLTKQP